MSEWRRRLAVAPARRWLEIASSAALLALTVGVVGAAPVWTRLRSLDVGWVAIALSITGVQFVLLAARWWFVARRLGVPLSYRRALAEYYLAALLNYVVPFGIFGDALRAVRHSERAGRTSESPSAARVVLAIMVERASGQLVLWFAALCVAPGWLAALSATTTTGSAGLRFAAMVLVVAVVAAAVWALSRGPLKRLRDASATAGKVLFGPGSMLVHVPLSALLVATHVALFAVAAQSMGLDLGIGAAIRLVPPVLVASTVPALLAGFGTREAAAAAMYHLAGLPAADGATVSFVYGGVSLLGSTPGLLVLLVLRRRDRRPEEPAAPVLG